MMANQSPTEKDGQLASQDADKECVPFWGIFKDAWGLLTGNMSVVWKYMLLGLVCDLGLLQLSAALEHSAPGIIATILAFYLIALPVLHMAVSRLALRL